MNVRRESLALAVLMAAALSPLAAQQPADTAPQGYVPPTAAPTPPPSAAPAAAPAPAPTPAPVSIPSSPTAGKSVAEALGFVDVIPARSVDRIRSVLEAARTAEREADARISESTSQRAQTRAMIEAKKREMSDLDARIKLADKQKQDADKTALTAEKRVLERQKQFLERRGALHDAEQDQAKALKRLAQSEQKALGLEVQLATRRDERGRAGGADPAGALRQDAVIRELELKTLQAQRESADVAKEVASRGQDLAKRRLDLYQAQMAASGHGQ